ncbi:Galactose oxidase/kelch repeat superfamily protein [Arabidopsis thaliana]|uniref:Putative F-box/kelch-repeat protein At2g29800 n=1 Tax=Arabidopsis thaliana TaxID=3702 RepID=FBK38_ARATH|nr:Galactose oxidase/kelch repeat superfamily protein [Arabidopsis thaliana]O82376.1 RecName: Full=Putative F-box/kelch-repeat protein At2g29800 [Arabidopsis thaliana]AAC35221.1 hypothetical protein [Arabidopsis thaliana]AEC08306.1 Galactose oxidase/kelch repeat superfamily protein [Arabidopsis thaliana]|eukprot:NP_180541.1 Galactose oxidase/kelch repeat superfamily protein [Arabidopsis thaliana]
MASISETSDDGSNGGVPNQKPEEPHKNPQEEKENQNENPNEADEEDDHQDEEVENVPPIPRKIPPVLIENTIAPLRRCHYPKLSLLSNAFRQVISSEDLFQVRSLIGSTEPVLYTLITFKYPTFEEGRWFILQRRNNTSLKLNCVTSLPPMFLGCTAVTIGHKIYVVGGYNFRYNKTISTVLEIDCRFNTCRHLRNMKRDRCSAVAGVIDGRIYVVAGRQRRFDDWVEVFDVETERWELVPGPFSSFASSSGKFIVHVVLDNKIYIMDGDYCFAYDPRRRRWETWGPESAQRSYWHLSSCVVDDLLYAIVPREIFGASIVVYDPRGIAWRPVMGLEFWPNLVYFESKMANFGGKLVILGCYRSSFDYYRKDVWCVEVALEKHEDGQIWGKVESLSLVNAFPMSPFFELSRTVTI